MITRAWYSGKQTFDVHGQGIGPGPEGNSDRAPANAVHQGSGIRRFKAAERRPRDGENVMPGGHGFLAAPAEALRQRPTSFRAITGTGAA
jgi:hypothetical protein